MYIPEKHQGRVLAPRLEVRRRRRRMRPQQGRAGWAGEGDPESSVHGGFTGAGDACETRSGDKVSS